MVRRTVKIPEDLQDSLIYLINHFPKSMTWAYVAENGFPTKYSMAYTMALRNDHFVCHQNQELISAVQEEESKFYSTTGIPENELVPGNTFLHVTDPVRPLVDRAIELQGQFINDMSVGTQTHISV